MVPIRRDQRINNLCSPANPSAGRGFCKRKASACGGYLRHQCGRGGDTRPVRAPGSVHVYVHTHIHVRICKDFALDAPACPGCASLLRGTRRQSGAQRINNLCRIQRTLSRQRVLYKKSTGFRRVSQTSVRVGGRYKTGQGSCKCACIGTHTYTRT